MLYESHKTTDVPHVKLETGSINPTRKVGNYQLARKKYMRPNLHSKDSYIVSSLGDPFPSYHSNPESTFPARWTQIPGVRIPCENITAPRIRLAPRELEKKWSIINNLAVAARDEPTRPSPTVLNLSHQSLGDPYQYDALRAFLELNSTVEVLNLDGNELEDITDLNLNSVKKLYMSFNNVATFLCLPCMPNLRELYIKSNFICGTEGLSMEKFPKLRRIAVSGNPIETRNTYRSDLVNTVDTLEVIDVYNVRELKRFPNNM
eukprot:Tbor_TRINITY_DN3923_c0_g1::TRINITY_DN3923_c0_g1_i1::g.733::m.733